jgi:ATP-binding cassette subfamily B multidrug efflux pump
LISMSQRRRSAGPDNGGLKRSLKYLTCYRYLAILPYLFLLLATLAQLAVPRLVGNIIDAITTGVMAQALTAQTDARRALITAGLAVVIFALMLGLFAFLQSFTAERNSQSVAFDLRNDLFAKIQRLSFSYHDRNRTGQLMIRATDDVEKVRLFIGQLNPRLLILDDSTSSVDLTTEAQIQHALDRVLNLSLN